MFPNETVLRVFHISQFCIGVLGNSLLFVSYVYTFLAQHHLKKPIDSIFIHLTIANVLTIVFALLPNIVSSFGVRHFLDDAGCKAVVYIYRVTRGLSICTTCILSAFQAITIIPSNSRWVWLKPKLSTWIIPSFLFSWFINMLIYIKVIRSMRATTNDTLAGLGFSRVYCQSRPPKDEIVSFWVVILTRDVLFMALMMWTSLTMVVLLCRHQRRAQHVHSLSLSSQTSPETKATQTVLLLVSCFVFFFWLSNIISMYGFYTREKIPRLEQINVILSLCYPTICPFILMKNNKIISQCTSSCLVLTITCTQRTYRG